MKSNSTYDITVIGGGIFGCSVAKHLSEKADLDICLLEKEYHLANHQSGRNSGTLHPGLALSLKPDTRKAQFAIEGGQRLRDYCETNGLQIRNRGLVLVARNDWEVERLEEVESRTRKLNVTVERLDGKDEINEIEPNVNGKAALFTPDSSTVNTQEITYQLAQDAWKHGVSMRLGYEVEKVRNTGDAIRVTTNKGTIITDYLVNAAGVWAPQLAQKLGIGNGYHMVPFRGQYYELTADKQDIVETNVYPTSMPPRVPNSVGVHFTRRPDDKVIVGPTGMIAFGPDTYGSMEFGVREPLRIISSRNFWKFIGSRDTLQIAWEELNKTYRKETFIDHAQRLIPEVKSSDLVKSYVGISHYLVDKTGSVQEESVFKQGPNSFHILRPKPGLTSSLSIGDYVSNVVLKKVTPDIIDPTDD